MGVPARPSRGMSETANHFNELACREAGRAKAAREGRPVGDLRQAPGSGSAGLVDQHGGGQVFQGAAHGLEDGDGLVAAAARVLATA